MNTVQRALSGLYGCLNGVRTAMYDWGIVDQLKFPVPVVSVGNLTMGGTGKTPVVDLLLSYFESSGIKAAVVSRNYKAQGSGIGRVNIHSSNGAFEFGDEPFWLAQRHPHFPVYVGPSKWRSAWQVVQDHHPEVIVIDDGFQHRALHRDFDIVLIDATTSLQDFDLLPLGRGREPWQALKRARWVILTKVNLAEPQTVEALRARIPKNVRVAELSYHLEKKFPVEANHKVLGFCGLASPQSFKKSLELELGCPLVDFISFPDHYSYQSADIQMLRARGQELGANWLVTTEKDWTKLEAWIALEPEFQSVQLVTKWQASGEEFYADLAQVIR